MNELEILGFLNENPTAAIPDKRVWIKSPRSAQWQFDTYFPISTVAEGHPESVKQEIADYLHNQLGLQYGGEDSAATASKVFTARPIMFEDDAKIMGFDHIPYQFFFDPVDMNSVKQLVVQRLSHLAGGQQAALPAAPPTAGQQIIQGGSSKPGQKPPPPPGGTPPRP